MENEPHRKRLKLSLTKKRPSHESSEGTVTKTTEAISVAAVCGQGATDSAVLNREDNSKAQPELASSLGPGDEESKAQPPESEVDHIEERREAYYSANFKSILKTVLSDSPERHVISETGAKVVEQFMALPEAQQQLYVRLFLRKHHWIRMAKLSYKDIADDLTDIVQALVDNGFLLDSSHLVDPTEVLNLLQLVELKGLCRQLNMPTSLVGNQKTSIIQAMFKHDRQQKPLFGQAQFMKIVVTKAKKVLGNCVKIAAGPREEFSRLMLLFSLTNSWIGGEEDTSSSQLIYRMLQVNVGMVVYPDYEVNVSHSLFRSTEHFEKYYVSTKHEQSMVQAIEEGDDTAVRRLLSGTVEAFKTELRRQDEAASSEQCPAQAAPFLQPFTSGWTYARVISRATEYLEKKKRHEEANELLELLLSQKLYCTGSRGRWVDRLALNCDHHLKRKDKCLEVIIEALKDPHLHDSKRLSLLQRARKICLSQQQNVSESKPKKKGALSKRRRASSSTSSSSIGVVLSYGIEDFPKMDIIEAPEIHITGHRLNTGPVYLTSTPHQNHNSTSSHHQDEDPSPSISIPDSTGQHTRTIVGVEGYAIHHYSTEQGWPCALHAEGSSFTTLFALLMWGVIFASGVPNVFRTKFQSGPLDLHSSCFCENRKVLIDERLTVIGQAGDEEISSLIEESWEKHYGQLCVGLNWELFPSREDAKNLGVCMGGELLSRICELFCKEYRQSIGGLPDLVLWNPATKMCKFVEVKGPGDRLSHKQIIWLSRLANWSCDVEVCRVTAKRNIYLM